MKWMYFWFIKLILSFFNKDFFLKFNTFGKVALYLYLTRGLLPHVYQKRCPRGVMVKAMNCGIVVREFVLQSRYYVHFRANTLGKGMNPPLILPPAMGK